MNTVSTTTPSQREANTIAFAQAASTMFAMDAMLSHEPRHLKMPRPDAYEPRTMKGGAGSRSAASFTSACTAISSVRGDLCAAVLNARRGASKVVLLTRLGGIGPAQGTRG